MSTEKQLEAALRRMDRLEDEIDRLKKRKKSKHVQQVSDRGGVVYRTKSDGTRYKPTVVLPPERRHKDDSKRLVFWTHVATHQ